MCRASDVYAFGTVWYELLTGEWPWKDQPPEAIIWQVLPAPAHLLVTEAVSNPGHPGGEGDPADPGQPAGQQGGQGHPRPVLALQLQVYS